MGALDRPIRLGKADLETRVDAAVIERQTNSVFQVKRN
jgi:hypothetical protein